MHKPTEDQLEFWIEASSDQAYEELQMRLPELQKALVNTVAEANTDFKKSSMEKPAPTLK